MGFHPAASEPWSGTWANAIGRVRSFPGTNPIAGYAGRRAWRAAYSIYPIPNLLTAPRPRKSLNNGGRPAGRYIGIDEASLMLNYALS